MRISASGANAGYVSFHMDNIWAADCSYCNDERYIYYLYEVLHFIQPIITNLQRGSAQPHVYAKDINRIKIIIPPTDVLIEINIGEEASKFGLDPSELTETLCEISEIGSVRVKGLMAIPPICDSSAEIRKFFMNMNRMFLDIKAKKLDNISMDILSMGMSGDYVEAILEGSTMVRVGSSLFGKRVY